jgi:hypothetical protein
MSSSSASFEYDEVLALAIGIPYRAGLLCAFRTEPYQSVTVFFAGRFFRTILPTGSLCGHIAIIMVMSFMLDFSDSKNKKQPAGYPNAWPVWSGAITLAGPRLSPCRLWNSSS